MNDNEKKEVLEYLSGYKLMSLGTYYKEPWAASVYFLCDDDFNLYFVSDPGTKHCKNIEKQGKVSVTVADSSQLSSDKKIGFQAKGVASRVNSAKELKEIVKAWNKRGFVPITYKLITKVWKSRFYRIRLTAVQLFDEHQSDENEVRYWKL